MKWSFLAGLLTSAAVLAPISASAKAETLSSASLISGRLLSSSKFGASISKKNTGDSHQVKTVEGQATSLPGDTLGRGGEASKAKSPDIQLSRGLGSGGGEGGGSPSQRAPSVKTKDNGLVARSGMSAAQQSTENGTPVEGERGPSLGSGSSRSAAGSFTMPTPVSATVGQRYSEDGGSSTNLLSRSAQSRPQTQDISPPSQGEVSQGEVSQGEVSQGGSSSSDFAPSSIGSARGGGDSGGASSSESGVVLPSGAVKEYLQLKSEKRDKDKETIPAVLPQSAEFVEQIAKVTKRNKAIREKLGDPIPISPVTLGQAQGHLKKVTQETLLSRSQDQQVDSAPSSELIPPPPPPSGLMPPPPPSLQDTGPSVEAAASLLGLDVHALRTMREKDIKAATSKLIKSLSLPFGSARKPYNEAQATLLAHLGGKSTPTMGSAGAISEITKGGLLLKGKLKKASDRVLNVTAPSPKKGTSVPVLGDTKGTYKQDTRSREAQIQELETRQIPELQKQLKLLRQERVEKVKTDVTYKTGPIDVQIESVSKLLQAAEQSVLDKKTYLLRQAKVKPVTQLTEMELAGKLGKAADILDFLPEKERLKVGTTKIYLDPVIGGDRTTVQPQVNLSDWLSTLDDAQVYLLETRLKQRSPENRFDALREPSIRHEVESEKGKPVRKAKVVKKVRESDPSPILRKEAPSTPVRDTAPPLTEQIDSTVKPIANTQKPVTLDKKDVKKVPKIKKDKTELTPLEKRRLALVGEEDEDEEEEEEDWHARSSPVVTTASKQQAEKVVQKDEEQERLEKERKLASQRKSEETLQKMKRKTATSSSANRGDFLSQIQGFKKTQVRPAVQVETPALQEKEDSSSGGLRDVLARAFGRFTVKTPVIEDKDTGVTKKNLPLGGTTSEEDDEDNEWK